MLTPAANATGTVSVTVTGRSVADGTTASRTFGVNLAQPLPPLTSIESSGNTVLNRDNDGKLYADSEPIMYGRDQLTMSTFVGYDWKAVEDFGDGTGGRQLVLQRTSDLTVFTWQLGTSWQRTGSLAPVTISETASIIAKEVAFGVDLTP